MMQNEQKGNAIRCHNCNGFNHYSKNCPLPQRAARCTGCDKVGSHHEFCPFNPLPYSPRGVRVTGPFMKIKFFGATKVMLADPSGDMVIDERAVEFGALRLSFRDAALEFHGHTSAKISCELVIGKSVAYSIQWEPNSVTIDEIMIAKNMIVYKNAAEAPKPASFIITVQGAQENRAIINYRDNVCFMSRKGGQTIVLPHNKYQYLCAPKRVDAVTNTEEVESETIARQTVAREMVDDASANVQNVPEPNDETKREITNVKQYKVIVYETEEQEKNRDSDHEELKIVPLFASNESVDAQDD